MKPKNRHFALFTACAAMFTQAASAADNLDSVSDWDNYLSTNPTSTSYFWGDTAMWDNGIVPDGVGAKANLAIDLNGANSNPALSPSIRLSNPGAPTTAVVRTLGSLTLGDTTSTGPTDGTVTNLSFGSFNFDNGGAGASLTTATSQMVQNTGFPPSAAVTVSGMNLNDNITITNNMGPAAGTYDSSTLSRSSLQINSITETGGARNVTYTGSGVGTTAVAAAGYTGNTSILSGRVSGSADTSFGTGTVTVSSGAQAQIVNSAGTYSNNFVLNGNGWSESSGTHGALYIAANSASGAKFHTFTGSLNIASASRIEAWSNVTANLDGALTGSANLELVGGVIRLNGNGSGYTGTVTSTQGRVDVNGTLGGNLIVTSYSSSLGGKGTISGNLELGAIAGPPLGTTLFVDSAAAGNLHVNGNVGITSNTTISLASAPPASSTILSYGSTLTGGSNFDLEGGIANYRAGTSIDTSTTGVVKLNYVTGTTTWNGGVAGAWSTFGTGWVGGDNFRPFDNVVFNDTAPGTVTVSGNLNAGTITVNSTGNYTIEAVSGNSIAAGALVKNGSGVLTMGSTTTTANNRHTYAGGTTINAGTVRVNLGGTSGLPYGPLGTGDITMNGGALTGIGTGGKSLYNKLNLNGSSTLGATATDTGRLTFFGGVEVLSNSVLNTASEVYIGSSATSAGLSGTATLTKTGSAILRINGTSTYNGAISVEAGTLTIGTAATLTIGNGGSLKTNGGSIAAGNATSSQLVIAAGASLGGIGAVNVSTTISGTHSPGNSPGLQSFGNGLAYNDGSTLAMEMADPTVARGTGYDAVDVTGGTFSLATGASMDIALGGTVNIADTYWNSNQSWLVIDLGSATTGDGGTEVFIIGAVTGGNYSPTEGFFSTSRLADGNGKNDVYLNWTAVPEPSSALLALLGASAFGFRRRRD